MPTETLRVQVLRHLAHKTEPSLEPLVWTWQDLWAEISRRGPDPRRVLSPAGERAACIAAIHRASRNGSTEALGNIVSTAGFRRRLRSQMSSWTRSGLDPIADGPRGRSAVDRAEWAIFAEYASLLDELHAVDAAGLEQIGSKALATGTAQISGDWNRFQLVIVDPPAQEGPVWSAIESFQERVRSIHVTLPGDPERLEAFAELDRARSQLLSWGFEVEEVPPDIERPAGLRTVSARLFPDDPHPGELESDVSGLRFLGAPQGEGVGLMVASRIRKILADDATSPEEIAVVVPRWDDQARVVADTIRAWGYEVADDDPARAIASDPAIAALIRAIRLPIEDWSARNLVRFLRNGQLRPNWPVAAQPLALATTANAIREGRVYHGAQAILTALKQAATSNTLNTTESEKRCSDQAGIAVAVMESMVEALDPLNRPNSWWDHFRKLETLRADLGVGIMDRSSSRAFEAWFDALDEHGDVLDSFGRDETYLSWREFVQEVSSLAREVALPAGTLRPGGIRFATPEVIRGGRFGHVLLVNLHEGTYPDRDAIILESENDGDREGGDESSLSMSKEMLRYLRVVGAADSSLTFVVPTTDEKGQMLLPTGFLEETRELFHAEALASCTDSRNRLGAVLPAEFAGSARERRVRAAAMVCNGEAGGEVELARLASDPRHRASLEGTAAALDVSAYRSARRSNYGPYDGMLLHPAAIQRIATEFHNDRYSFSASQLESLATCPFQFFQRYVLRLSPLQELDEFDEDTAARGSLIHTALERLYKLMRLNTGELEVGGSDALLEALLIQVERLLDEFPSPDSRVTAGLRAIEAERIRRVARRYIRQHMAYVDEAGRGAVPLMFEASFGREDSQGNPPLEIGSSPDMVKIQGLIDRVDAVELPGGPAFRVIDYKSGYAPNKGQLNSGLALQLPLYALAVERILLADRRGRALDAGYWALRGEGYKALTQMSKLDGDEAIPIEFWNSLSEAIERFVLDLVAQLRVGSFPVAPRSDDCTRRCDYKTVCRIKQVVHAGKHWPRAPRLELDP